MIPGMNPRKMAQAMRRMGISQVEIPASEVIIKCEDKDIVITEPQVSKVNMMGQETFQIVGNVNEREKKVEVEINEEDIKTIMEQVEVDEESAREALLKAEGDIAKAIMDLRKE